ncbi:uncharacterized protein SRS1_16292 [Sporisorium reilianum f. sp. reilianum]|uniref:AA1-like domain-containing protein n=1 Tax=Sporisorium reilianum f. sp. reilianum TaxID=72559 RepID=A0A2N8UL64_9BASI|nr:uncharacterized protein SRS1_16292 [Sporisorium reilianum f. sp. reilianum]
MKSMIVLSAIVSAALTTSVAAMPAFKPRDGSSTTCGKYHLAEPAKLQGLSSNGTVISWFGVLSQTSKQILELTSTSATHHNEVRAYTFNFQECGYQGFTQGYSRNEFGSQGAPLEYWGRVVANDTVYTGGKDVVEQKCLTATSGTFHLLDCDEKDSAQWFRLQVSFGKDYIDYFPVKNATGYKYTGQTPEHWVVPVYADPDAYNVDPVQYTTARTNTQVAFA